jgi:hypothetical protein
MADKNPLFPREELTIGDPIPEPAGFLKPATDSFIANQDRPALPALPALQPPLPLPAGAELGEFEPYFAAGAK